MTNDSINQAIAEERGWKDIHRRTRGGKKADNGVVLWGTDPNGDSAGGFYEQRALPNYVDSLDAMREVELSMNDDELYQYGDILAMNVCRKENIIFGDPEDEIFPFNGSGNAALAMISARDRALAWLKVKRPDFFVNILNRLGVGD